MPDNRSDIYLDFVKAAVNNAILLYEYSYKLLILMNDLKFTIKMGKKKTVMT